MDYKGEGKDLGEIYAVETAGFYDQLIFFLRVKDELRMTCPKSLIHSLNHSYKYFLIVHFVSVLCSSARFPDF